jgi:hypothetical protein
MSERDVIWQERRLEEILFSNADPAIKVQQITRLGFDDEIANELVERHLVGSQVPAYYETLEFDPEYDAALSEQELHDADGGDTGDDKPRAA